MTNQEFYRFWSDLEKAGQGMVRKRRRALRRTGATISVSGWLGICVLILMAIIYATGPETLLVILILVGVSMLAVGAGAVVYEFGCGMISQEDSLKAAVKAIKDIGELDARVLETHNEQLNNRVNKYLACSSVDKAGFEILRTLMADGYTGSIKDVMLMSVKLAA